MLSWSLIVCITGGFHALHLAHWMFVPLLWSEMPALGFHFFSFLFFFCSAVTSSARSSQSGKEQEEKPKQGVNAPLTHTAEREEERDRRKQEEYVQMNENKREMPSGSVEVTAEEI